MGWDGTPHTFGQEACHKISSQYIYIFSISRSGGNTPCKTFCFHRHSDKISDKRSVGLCVPWHMKVQRAIAFLQWAKSMGQLPCVQPKPYANCMPFSANINAKLQIYANSIHTNMKARISTKFPNAHHSHKRDIIYIYNMYIYIYWFVTMVVSKHTLSTTKT